MPSTRYPPPTDVPAQGSKLLCFGHSYLTAGGVSHPDRQYITLLSGMLRADLIDLAQGGAVVSHDQLWKGESNLWGGWAWVLQQVVPTGGSGPYAPEGFLPFLHYGVNEIFQHFQQAGSPRTIVKTALRTVMSRLCAAKVFEDTDATVAYGGLTWQLAHATILRNSGRSLRPVPGNTATVTITLPADYAGEPVAIGFTVYPLTDGQLAITGTAAHGSPTATQLAGLAHGAGGTGNARDSSNGLVIRLSNLSAADATKTLIVTYSGGAGTAFANPPQPGVITQGGTPGATSYSYKWVWRTYNGDTVPSTVRSTATGNATLSATNYNTIPTPGAFPAGVDQAILLRTAGGTTQGIIAILDAPAAYNDTSGANAVAYTDRTANPLTTGPAFDYWQIEAANPVTRGVIVKANRLVAGIDADVVDYNTDVDALVGEFAAGQWLAVDIDTALGKTTALFAADGTHPNDRGSAVIAATLFTAMDAWFAGISSTDAAHISRVMKRVTSRRLVIQRNANNFGLAHGERIAHAGPQAIPWGASVTADYIVGTTLNLLDTWSFVPSIDALAGDDIEVEICAMAANVAQTLTIDAAFLTAANAVIRYFSANLDTPTVIGAFGNPAWYQPAEAVLRPITGTAFATVTPADLVTINTVPGQVKIGILAKTGAATRNIYAGGTTGTPPFVLAVRNVGRRNVGFNTS